jgi:hypothetical protein
VYLWGIGFEVDPFSLHLFHDRHHKQQFIEAMKKEVQDQMDNGNFSFCKREDVPKEAQIIPGVWALKRKRKI